MAKVSVNGTQIGVRVEAGLLPLDTVFLHGNLASNVWWEPTIAELQKQAQPGLEGRFIGFEWRGCGESAAPTSEEQLHPIQLAKDLIETLRSLNVKKACLVGHSTGGLIGLAAMAQAPELFDRAVMLDTVGPKGIQFGPEMYAAFTQMSESRDVTAAVMGSTIHNNPVAPELFQRIVDSAFNIAKINWHGVPKALHVTDITPELKKIQHPILVLHGEHDPIIPLSSSQELAASLPQSRLEIVANHGHSLNVEDPALWVKTMSQFLFHRP